MPRPLDLGFDPIRRAAQIWAERFGPADAMAAATSVMRVQQLLLAQFDTICRPHGLTFARYEALVLLTFSRTGALPMAKIGERLMVHPTSVTNTVQRLEAAGFVDARAEPPRRARHAGAGNRAGPRGRRQGHWRADGGRLRARRPRRRRAKGPGRRAAIDPAQRGRLPRVAPVDQRRDPESGRSSRARTWSGSRSARTSATVVASSTSRRLARTATQTSVSGAAGPGYAVSSGGMPRTAASGPSAARMTSASRIVPGRRQSVAARGASLGFEQAGSAQVAEDRLEELAGDVLRLARSAAGSSRREGGTRTRSRRARHSRPGRSHARSHPTTGAVDHRMGSRSAPAKLVSAPETRDS